MKNHKDYCIDIIRHNPYGCSAFDGLEREERWLEWRGRVERSCTWQKGYSMVFVTRNRRVSKICHLIQENLRMQPMQRKQTFGLIVQKNLWAMGLRSFLRYLLLACMAWTSVWVYAAEPLIINAAVNVDETLLVTTQGKTASVWDIASGKKKYDVQIPKDGWSKLPKFTGNITTAVFDPQNRWLAIGGMAGYVYLFESNAGNFYYKLPIYADIMQDLCISEKGEYIAGTTSGGILLWSTTNWKLISYNREYHNNDVPLKCEFIKDNSLITVSANGYIRLHDTNNNLALIDQIKPFKLAPSDFALHPDKVRIAVAYHDNIILINTASMQTYSHINNDITKSGNYAMTISWSLEGEKLYSGGSFCIENNCPVLVWDKKGTGEGYILKSKRKNKNIRKIIPLKNEKIVVVTSEPVWLIQDDNGRILSVHNIVVNNSIN